MRSTKRRAAALSFAFFGGDTESSREGEEWTGAARGLFAGSLDAL